MKKRLKLLVLAALCLNFNLAFAQEISSIRVGEAIPALIWNKDFQVINPLGKSQFIKLKDYGDKLIILDFWATYCHPCIASLEYLHSISAEFGDDLVVIPVQVYDDRQRGEQFLKKQKWNWPSITNDTTLNKVMLRRYLTGFGIAWIKNGRLLAVPSKKQLTSENIRKVIAGQKVQFINRNGYTN